MYTYGCFCKAVGQDGYLSWPYWLYTETLKDWQMHTSERWRKGMFKIWFIGERWKLILASPHHLEIWVRLIVEFHSKLSCHLITLLPYIFMGFKWSQSPIPTQFHCQFRDLTLLWKTTHKLLVVQDPQLIPDNSIIVGHQYCQLFLTFQIAHRSQTSC